MGFQMLMVGQRGNEMVIHKCYVKLSVLRLLIKGSSIFTFVFLKTKASPNSGWPVALLVIQGWFEPPIVENAPVQPQSVHHWFCRFPWWWREHSASFSHTEKAIESMEMCSSKTSTWMYIHDWEPLFSIWLNPTPSNAFWRHTTRGR